MVLGILKTPTPMTLMALVFSIFEGHVLMMSGLFKFLKSLVP